MDIKFQDLDQVALPGLQDADTLKVYIVPVDLSADRYYMSITHPGNVEVAPPSRSKDTLLVLAARQSDGSLETIQKHTDLEVIDA